jgi:arginase family enzyme
MNIIEIPLVNSLGKTKGCEKAPERIINCLKKEIYSNEFGKVINNDLLDIFSLKLDNFNLEKSNKTIYEKAFKCFKKNYRTTFLGGDHSVSYSLTRAFFDFIQNSNSGKEPCLIVFDAHLDCCKIGKNFKEPTHEEWLRKLIEDGFPCENILLVGVRNYCLEEIKFVKEKNIRILSINSFLENLEDSCDLIMEFSNKKELYVSIDIDVIDPAFASGTGYREPGGFSSREFIYIMQRLNKTKSLRALDIVEINPEIDKDDLTIKLGAKILSEFL